MNIEQLLEAARELESKKCNCDGTCEVCKCHEAQDLATEPADMETMETKEIEIKEPEVDTKELLRKLEDFDLSVLDAIKEQDPEMQFEMIDGKQPLKECDTQLISDEEKAARAEELKKTRAKRNTKPEEVVEQVIDEDLKPEIEDGSAKEIKAEPEQIDCEKEVKKAVEEPKEVKVEDIVKNESVQDEIVAKYESKDGKHEIIRTAEGLYKNRYFLNEEGKARRTTRGVKTLPTAVGALMKRFPEATEIKETTEEK